MDSHSPEDSVSASQLGRGPSTKARKKRDTLRVMMLSGPFEVRGSSAQTLLLAEQLLNYGIHPSIVTSDMRFVSPERKNKLNISEYHYLAVPFLNRVIHRLILQDLQEKTPHLIHVQTRSMLWHGVRLARLFRCPYVMTVHDYLNPGEILAFDRQYGRKIIAVSQSVKSELLTQPSIVGEDITVIHNGVDPIPEEQTMNVLEEGRTPVIGMAGPLEAIKGGQYFLEAARLVLEKQPNVEFLVAGSGPEEHSLRQKARQLKIAEKTTFVSNLFGFAEVFQAIDIFCLPSIKQALGTIMLEAMAWGRPIVASKVGGVATAIEDGKTGYLVPPSNAQELAQKFLEVLQDPDKAREIGQAGRIHVNKNFRIDQSVGLIADLYRSTHAEFVGKLDQRSR